MAIEKIARGYKTECLMDFEESFGQAPETHGGVILPINSFKLTVNRAKNSAKTLIGRRDPVEPFDGNVETSGDIEVPVDARAFGWWLRNLFGSPVTSGDAAPYTHVFQPKEESPSTVLQCSYGTEPETFGLYSGCKVSQLQLSAGGDDELTATITMAGQIGTFSETNYNDKAAPVTLKRFSNFQAALKRDGKEFAVCTAFSFTFDNGLDTDTRTLGSQGKLYDIPEGIMSVTGSVTCLFTSLAMLEEAQTSKEMALELTFAIDDNTSLSFLLPEVQIQYQGPTVEGPTGIKVEYPFVAYYNDSTENTVCKVTLKNDVASYAD